MDVSSYSAASAPIGSIKVLWWDGTGLCLYAKRLERGRFVWPLTHEGTRVLTPAQLSILCEGIDWRMPVRTEAAGDALALAELPSPPLTTASACQSFCCESKPSSRPCLISQLLVGWPRWLGSGILLCLAAFLDLLAQLGD